MAKELGIAVFEHIQIWLKTTNVSCVVIIHLTENLIENQNHPMNKFKVY